MRFGSCDRRGQRGGSLNEKWGKSPWLKTLRFLGKILRKQNFLCSWWGEEHVLDHRTQRCSDHDSGHLQDTKCLSLGGARGPLSFNNEIEPRN